MKLNTKQLRAALNDVGRVLKGRSTLPSYACVKLSMTDDDRLQLECTNGESWVTRKIECAEGIAPVLVKHSLLSAFLNNVGDESVELLLTGTKLTINSSRPRVVSTMDAAEFPSAPDVKWEPIAVNLDDLADGIEAVNWSASKDQHAEAWKLCCTVILADQSIECFASTGTRMALFNRLSVCGNMTVMLPSDMCPLLVPEMRREGSGALLTGNLFKIESGSGSVIIKRSEAKPVPYKSVTDLRLKLGGTVFNRDVLRLNCQDAMTSGGMDKIQPIKISREGKSDNVTISFQGADAEGTDSIEAEGDALEMLVPADALDTALAKATTETVKIITLPHVAFIESAESTFAISQMVKG